MTEPTRNPDQHDSDQAKAEHLHRIADVAMPATDMPEGEQAQWIADQEIRVGESNEGSD